MACYSRLIASRLSIDGGIEILFQTVVLFLKRKKKVVTRLKMEKNADSPEKDSEFWLAKSVPGHLIRPYKGLLLVRPLKEARPDFRRYS